MSARLRQEPVHPLLRGVRRPSSSAIRAGQARNAAQYLRRDGPLRHRAGAAPHGQDPPLQGLRRALQATGRPRRRPGGGPERHLPAARQLRARRPHQQAHPAARPQRQREVHARQRAQARAWRTTRASPRARSTASTGSSPRRSWSRAPSASASDVPRGTGELATLRAPGRGVHRRPHHLRAAGSPALPRARAPSARSCSSRRSKRRAWATGTSGRLRPLRLHAATGSSATSAGASTRRCSAAYGGDYLKVLRHVQVERFYISRRYQVGTVTVEPQMSVDAGVPPGHRGPHAGEPAARAAERGALRAARRRWSHANRGLIEYADLLKRPLEAFKYLLGTSETAQVPLEHFVLQLDEVLIASSNEKHLGAFKELPDFASFKGRIELVRVPYLRRYQVEQEIYDAQITATTVGKHVAPHATEVAAHVGGAHPPQEADPRPLPARREGAGRRRHARWRSCTSTRRARAPERLAWRRPRSCRKRARTLYEESDAYPNYEGRSGASRARDQDGALQRRAEPRLQVPHRAGGARGAARPLQGQERLRVPPAGGGGRLPRPRGVRARRWRASTWTGWTRRCATRWGSSPRASTASCSSATSSTCRHWVKGEKMRNRVTGEMERPDEQRMARAGGHRHAARARTRASSAAG